jgi:UDP:flavonoid glycosyltransferase YjiC (YdhE family)
VPRWLPTKHALYIDEEHMSAWPDRPKGGIAQVRYDVKNIFIEFIRGALRDLESELRRDPADVVVADNTSAVVEALHHKLRVRWALYGITVLGMESADTAPFGLALPPSSTAAGRLRNKTLYWFVNNVVFREASRYNAKLRRELKLPPLEGGLFNFAKRADLYLQGSVPSFEYPRTDMPQNVHFIGAPMPPMPANWTPPSWWSQLQHRRVILVTQGTINNDFDQLIRPAIRALADENALIVVTTGSRNPEDVAIDPLPENVRVERFIPLRRARARSGSSRSRRSSAAGRRAASARRRG